MKIGWPVKVAGWGGEYEIDQTYDGEITDIRFTKSGRPMEIIVQYATDTHVHRQLYVFRSKGGWMKKGTGARDYYNKAWVYDPNSEWDWEGKFDQPQPLEWA